MCSKVIDTLRAQAAFDFVVQDEIQLLRRKSVAPRQYRVDVVEVNAALLSGNQIRLQRSGFIEVAYTHYAESDHLAIHIETLPHGIVQPQHTAIS